MCVKLELINKFEVILGHFKNRLPPSRHKNGRERSNQESEFWSGVDRDLIREVYDIYKLDFRLFGYDIEEYLDGL